MAVLLRGRILTFNRMPQSVEDEEAFRFIQDGALVMDGGKITALGSYDVLRGQGDEIDHRPHLILPGFIDPHLHFPQAQVVGSYAAALLDWLNDYTFPEEMKFSDPGHATRIAKAFYDQLLAHGTTSAMAFCSSSPVSVDAYFEEAQKRGMRMLGGKTMMDRNAPEGLCDTAQSGYDDSADLIAKWHGIGRCSYAITPRFAITSSEAQMEAVSALARAHPSLHVQSHLSENKDEITLTAELFPNARDYLDVYDHYGLLGPKTLMGHAIHLSARERARMAESRTVAVHCPTSNLFLGSGLFDLFGLEDDGVRSAIATDIGGGTNWSMLKTLDEAYKIQQMNGKRLTPLKSFYWATLGNAEALGMADEIGTLDVGTAADVVVLNTSATPAMALRAERIESLVEELFVLQTMGDDRSVAAVYVAGQDNSVTA